MITNEQKRKDFFLYIFHKVIDSVVENDVDDDYDLQMIIMI